MNKPLITIDRTELEKIISEMSLFDEVKKVIKQYKKEQLSIDERKKSLQERLVELQEKHTKNILEQDTFKDVIEWVYLKQLGKEIIQEMEIIETLLEELNSEQKNLKLSYVPLFQQSLEEDRKNRPGYSVNDTVHAMRWELIKAIADLSQAMKEQQAEIREVFEVFHDPAVKEVYPRVEYMLNSAKVKPLYSESFDTVISRYMVFAAVDGQIHPDVRPPKKGETNE